MRAVRNLPLSEPGARFAAGKLEKQPGVKSTRVERDGNGRWVVRVFSNTTNHGTYA